MKKLIYIFLFLIITSCTQYDAEVNITDVTKPQTIILKNNKKGNVYAFEVHVSGFIQGDAEITLMLNKKPYKTKKISNEVSFKFSGDWYTNETTIIYKSSNVSGGNLQIEYYFETM